ncbi:MAG: rhomboid family intramembrane serine protease [Acidimicrobiales bacterium]|nr:rhomboid family intramembrane serine protease [Acidimicrobiales bacterium]
MSSPDPSGIGPIAPPRCYMHDDRVAGSICRRCGRPICPDCMREAPVGWQCTRCVREGARLSPTIRWRPRSPGRLGATRITPVVVALIVVNVVIFIWEETNLIQAENRFGIWPYGVHYRHQWYRLITNAFLHTGPEHIILNMLTLAIIGPAVEAEIGPVRFLAVYLLSAVGGAVCFELVAPINHSGVGASGAIFGVMGAYYVLARLRHWDVQSITGLLVINVIFSFAVPGVGWQTHLGGLVVGGAVCFGLVVTPRSWGRPSELVQVVQGLAVLIASAAVLGLLATLPVGHVNL